MRWFFRLFFNLIRLSLFFVWLPLRLFARPRGPWAMLVVHSHIVQFASSEGWLRKLLLRMSSEKQSSLAELREMVEAIIESQAIEKVLIKLPHLHAGWTTCQELRELIEQLNEAGKHTVIFLSHGATNREYYVACAAKEWMPPHASLSVLGVGSSICIRKSSCKNLVWICKCLLAVAIRPQQSVSIPSR
ncbi:MAG: hypothetical protein IPJ88_09315 [Myxococcales bacterium]|nr:MAG: hypothetical protein IPJ88_09315 [Myxococcales bacterium]